MTSRRKFLKHAAMAPLIPGLATTSIFSSPTTATPSALSHKFKISLNVFSFNALLRAKTIDLFDVLDFCAKYNFDAIDPTGYYFPGYPAAPTDEYINKFKRKAFLLGLDISGTGVRNNFADPDADKRKQDIALIQLWISTAAKLGSPNLRIFTGRHQHEGFSRDQVFEWMAKDITTCCEYGARHGVMICLQNHNEFLKTADDVDRLFEMVDSEWLGLNLDIGSYREKDPYQEIEQNIKHAVTWQIKENVWIDGKATPVDLSKLFKIIKKANYRGYLPIETLGKGDPFEKVPRMLEQVREALRQ